MNKWQSQVGAFHRKFAIPVNVTGIRLSRPLLRASLIKEEAEETVNAMLHGDLPEAVDGLCDLIYVCLGAALEFGIDLEPYFAEVHATNMAKDGGATRPDGKLLKPPGWQPPRIAEMIQAKTGEIR